MEETTSVKRVQKISSTGSLLVYISQEAGKLLRLNGGDKAIEKVDLTQRRLIYEVEGTSKLRMPPIVDGEG